jgi:predicted acyltransferase
MDSRLEPEKEEPVEKGESAESAETPAEPTEAPAAPTGWVSIVVERPSLVTKGRLMSLDALRGFDMFWIIGGYTIVMGLGKALNNAWFDTYIMPQVRHMDWAGFTAWDLIMPLFLFVVGTAMPFSFAKRLAQGEGKARLFLHVIYRVIILWILGMIAQGRLLEYDLAQLRFFSNTLQAIAAGYLISSIILLSLPLLGQFAATAALLLLYWGLMMLVPVPGHEAGQLTPEVNLAMYIDKLILGPYQDGTTYTWILSSMTFAATVMMGAFAGQLLRSELHKALKFLILLAAGLACVALGWAWGLRFPIIKHIWTSSMVLYAGGWSLLLLCAFYLVIDVLRLRFLAFFFVVIGMNAIAVYMVTRVFDFRNIGDIFVHGLAQWTGDGHDFVRAVAGFAVLWSILFYMYRKRTFIKI